MMIAARLAGGNLFFAFLGGGGILGALGAPGALGFFEGIFFGGILFFGGWWGVFWIVSVGKN